MEVWFYCTSVYIYAVECDSYIGHTALYIVFIRSFDGCNSSRIFNAGNPRCLSAVTIWLDHIKHFHFYAQIAISSFLLGPVQKTRSFWYGCGDLLYDELICFKVFEKMLGQITCFSGFDHQSEYAETRFCTTKLLVWLNEM